jgi:hypothetical protein
MIRTAAGFLALLALMPALQARDKPKTPAPAQQYQALVKEYRAAQMEFQKAYTDAKTPQDKQKVLQDKYPQPDKFAPRFLEVAEKNPQDPAALDALVWVVTNVRGTKSDPKSPRAKALTLLLRDHVQSEKMAAVCQPLGFAQDEESRKLLHAVLEKNKHRPAQAQACRALAQQAENSLRLARRFKDQPELAKRYESFMGKEAIEALGKADLDKLSKEAEKLYERIVKQFADVTDARGGGGTLGKMAEQKLEALRHPILVGKPAPEIEGEDLDGKKFKLSDYRGKVVLLDFWGNW